MIDWRQLLKREGEMPLTQSDIKRATNLQKKLDSPQGLIGVVAHMKDPRAHRGRPRKFNAKKVARIFKNDLGRK